MRRALLDELREAVARALDEVEGVVALRAAWGGMAPYLFRSREELGELALSPKYPLPAVLQLIQKSHPESKLGIVCRGCEERGLIEMAKRGQIDLNNVLVIGLACTAEEARECRCEKPYPGVLVTECVGEKVEGVADELVEQFLAQSTPERLDFWRAQFAKCIKCYGCRNACPQCFCEECALEEELWVERGQVPPPFPVFHLIRAMHTVGKCVGCRECELACPADIPLTLLYTLLRRDVRELFGYEAGRSVEEEPPLVVTLEE
ncbi:MAG TPA: 4Fe-4S ferredoxin [Anaerolineae bacterium]|nr:4Fe-4S ferredoxin [Anaerolineae bacterium]